MTNESSDLTSHVEGQDGISVIRGAGTHRSEALRTGVELCEVLGRSQIADVTEVDLAVVEVGEPVQVVETARVVGAHEVVDRRNGRVRGYPT